MKINVLDTPGNFDFVGEMQSGVRAAEVWACWCAPPRTGSAWAPSAAGSISRSRRSPAWSTSPRRTRRTPTSPPRWRPLRGKFGSSLAPVVAPIWDENKRTVGIIDVLNKKAYTSRRRQEAQAGGDPHPREQALRGGGALRPADGGRGRDHRGEHGEVLRRRALHQGGDPPGPEGRHARRARVAPVLCGSATHRPRHRDAAPDHRGPGALPPGDARGGGGE